MRDSVLHKFFRKGVKELKEDYTPNPTVMVNRQSYVDYDRLLSETEKKEIVSQASRGLSALKSQNNNNQR